VLPSVDDAALAAVYRALLKKYHPDVFQGSKVVAERKTRDIIEAYGVLSNPNHRLAYEAARQAAANPENHKSQETEQEEETAYKPYVPEEWIDLNKIHAERLAKARRRTLVVSGLVATGVIVLASVGQQQQPTTIVAPREDSAHASSIRIPTCATRPVNGAILTIASRNPGSNIFEFVNERSGNAIVKVRDDTSGTVVVSFFVAAGSEASFNRLPEGTFQYALGGDLAQDCHSFAHAYAIYEIPGAETFVSKRDSFGTIYRQKLTYTLLAEASPAGNSRPYPIDAVDFNAN
jgi:DnaJ domain